MRTLASRSRWMRLRVNGSPIRYGTSILLLTTQPDSLSMHISIRRRLSTGITTYSTRHWWTMAFPMKSSQISVRSLTINAKNPHRLMRLDYEYVPPKPKKQYIPPMSHPWKRAFFERYIATRKHHNATEVASLMR